MTRNVRRKAGTVRKLGRLAAREESPKSTIEFKVSTPAEYHKLRDESYFCPHCQRLVKDRCVHWSLQLAVAGYSCHCGKEGLAPQQDWHCTDCHKDFANADEFFGLEHHHSHNLKVAV